MEGAAFVHLPNMSLKKKKIYIYQAVNFSGPAKRMINLVSPLSVSFLLTAGFLKQVSTC